MAIGRRLLFSGTTGFVVALVAYSYLIVHKPRLHVLESVVSHVVYPGWGTALLVFPEGVHAGGAFLLLSMVANWVFYTLIVLGIAFIAGRLKAVHHSRK